MNKKTQFIRLYDKQALLKRRETLSKDVVQQTKLMFERLSEVRIRSRLSIEQIREIVSQLRREFPNFSEATDYINQQLILSAASTSKGSYFPPLLLLGPPGIGKTHYARELAKLLGVGFEKIDLSTTTSSMVLSGSSSQWGNSKPGIVASHLLQNHRANPVLVLDEIDKAGQKTSSGGDATNALLTLLEPESAREFQDEFVQVPMDASHICVIATANNVNLIDEPILSRFKKITVSEPTPEQLRQIAPYALDSLIKQSELEPIMSATLSTDALNALQLRQINVRELNEILRLAMFYGVQDKSRQLSEFHITKAVKHTRGDSAKPKPKKNLH